MERIIVDKYQKGKVNLWEFNPDSEITKEFNKKVLAVNDMFGRLYEKGILEKVSFEFKDYSDVTYFAFDVKDLLPYRAEMESCGITNSKLAAQHIFDEEYTPCNYCGAIQLSWPMATYRDVDGCVGRSWENNLVQGLGNNDISELPYIVAEKGVKNAVQMLFKNCEFKPSDLKPSLKDVIHSCEEMSKQDELSECVPITLEIVKEHMQTVNLGDYDLDGVEITEDDYATVFDRAKKTDKTVDEIVHEYLIEIREVLDAGLEEPLLDDVIKAATEFMTVNQSVKEFVFTPIDYEKAKAALLSSGDDSMYWKNEGYSCFLERDDNEEIYYDLHLTDTGTTIMYGEVVELLSEEAGRVSIRVPDGENEFGFINKEFFEKNFSPSSVPDRRNIKENINQER